TGGAAGGRDPLGGVVGRSRWCVEFAGVVGLDDLGGVEVGGGEVREAHGQDRPDREVRGDEHRSLRVFGECGLEAGQTVIVPAGGAHDGVDVVLDEEADVVFGRLRDGEFDGDVDVGIEQGLERIAAAEGGDEVDSFGLVDR